MFVSIPLGGAEIARVERFPHALDTDRAILCRPEFWRSRRALLAIWPDVPAHDPQCGWTDDPGPVVRARTDCGDCVERSRGGTAAARTLVDGVWSWRRGFGPFSAEVGFVGRTVLHPVWFSVYCLSDPRLGVFTLVDGCLVRWWSNAERSGSLLGIGARGMSRNEEAKNAKPAPYAYEGLERIFHEKARLGIVTCLVRHPDGLVFPELKSLCDLTDGNLNRHLHHLEESGIVQLEKRFEGNRPQTLCRITKAGLKRFTTYLDQLQKALEDARPNAIPATTKTSASRGRLRPSTEGL